MVSKEVIYTDFVNVCKREFYLKSIIDSKLMDKADKNTSYENVQVHDNPKNRNLATDTNGDIIFEEKLLKTHQLINTGDNNDGSIFVKSNDIRLTDNRTPKSHSHGNISNNGKIGNIEGKIIGTGMGGLLVAMDSISVNQINDFPSSITPSTHTHSTNEIIDSESDLSQDSINQDLYSSLDGKVGSDSVYLKNETYSKSEVNSILTNGVGSLDLVEVVEELPTSNIYTNKLYLVVSGESISENIYDVYLYVNDTWEQVDKFEVNLSDYYDKSSIDTLLDGKVDSDDSRLSDARTPVSHSHGSLSNDGKLNSVTDNVNKIVVTDSNNVLKTINSIGYDKITGIPSIPSQLSDLVDDSDFISTSDTRGLVRNDGSIDTTNYLTSNSLSDYVQRSSISTVGFTGSYNDLLDKPVRMTPSEHIHNTSNIIEENSFEYIGSSSGASQSSINAMIDNVLEDIIENTPSSSGGTGLSVESLNSIILDLVDYGDNR